MRTGKVIVRIMQLTLLIVLIVIADWLIGWRPRFGLEAEFQRVINQAQIVDHYRRSEGLGWDKEDVSNQICDRVDATILSDLGMTAIDGSAWRAARRDTPETVDIWRVDQDKGAFASCRDVSRRYLRIEIDRHTSACMATVSVFPSCDL